MEFERAVLPFDHQDAGAHHARFQRHIRQRLDVETRRDFDDLCSHARTGQRAPYPGGEVGQCLGLQLVDKDE